MTRRCISSESGSVRLRQSKKLRRVESARSLKSRLLSIPEDGSSALLYRVKVVAGSGACAVLIAQTLTLLYLASCHGHLSERQVHV